MSLIGYARVSTTDQSLDIQLEQLRDAGCEKIFAEQVTGTSRQDRQRLADCLDYLREGDILIATRLDRLARSLADLIEILKQVEAVGASFKCLQQAVDTTTSEGRLMISMLGAFAEFEADIRRERQREGIERARKIKGKYPGAKRKITREMVSALKAQGMGASEIARSLKCDRKTVYRAHPDGWTGDNTNLNGGTRHDHA